MKNKIQGITIIELIIALFLSSMIITACFHIFLILQHINITQHAIARMQENARVISVLLGKAIQENGSVGCNAFRSYIPIKNHLPISLVHYGLIANHGILGSEREILRSNPLIMRSVIQRIVSGNDILWLQGAIHRTTLLQAVLNLDYLPIHENSHFLSKVKEGKILILSDCESMDILQMGEKTNVIPISLSKQYQAGSEVALLTSKLFYIGKTRRTHQNGEPLYALYMTDLNDRTVEWVEGVENMEIWYGHKEEKVIAYQKYAKIQDWQAIISIRVKVVLRSLDDVIKPQSWMFEWPIQKR